LWNIAPEDARMKTFELEDAVGAATHAGPARTAVGASAGAAMLAAEDTTADVLARADAAMYARKAERRTLKQ